MTVEALSNERDFTHTNDLNGVLCRFEITGRSGVTGAPQALVNFDELNVSWSKEQRNRELGRSCSSSSPFAVCCAKTKRRSLAWSFPRLTIEKFVCCFSKVDIHYELYDNSSCFPFHDIQRAMVSHKIFYTIIVSSSSD